MKKFKNIKICNGKHECQFKLTLAEYGLKKRQEVISLQKKTKNNSNKFLTTLFEGGVFLDNCSVNVFRSFAKMRPDIKRKK